MSGHPDAMEKCERFGFAYMSKPFGLVTLRRETAAVLANGRAIILRSKEPSPGCRRRRNA
jgi:hypothetical protein